MGRAQAATAARIERLRSRVADWDPFASVELALDFKSTTPKSKSSIDSKMGLGKAGIKETILRWLEERL